MKSSLGISNFFEEISSLSHSIVFLYFFALITEEGFLISPHYSLELYIQLDISFPFSFAFHFSSFLSYLKGLLRQPLCLLAFLFSLGRYVPINVNKICGSLHQNSCAGHPSLTWQSTLHAVGCSFSEIYIWHSRPSSIFQVLRPC